MTVTATELTGAQAQLVADQVESALRRHDGVVDCAVVFDGPQDLDTAGRACLRCRISGRYPGIAFDDAGVCSLCTMYETNRDRIHAYFRPLDELAPKLRAAAQRAGSDYDCLLLFSGGKDSSYVLYRLVDLGLRVMTFTFDNGFISRTALRNVETITGELGVEHVTATRADQNTVFLQSLREHKSVCNGCFRSLLDLSTELAHRRGIPSILTGLSRGQIMDERLSWFHRNGIFDPVEIERKLALGRQVYHGAGSRIDGSAVDAVEVVDFYRYSDVSKDGIRELLRQRSELWAQPQDTGFCSSNCIVNDVGVYVHTAERGFHNYEAPTRWEVRLGHLDVAEADEELRAPVDVARVRRMLAKIGYPDPDGRVGLGSRLTAYYVTGPAGDAGLREAVARQLPESVVPERFVAVDRIPRRAGMVDRDALTAHAGGPHATRFGTDEPDGDRTYPLTAAQRAVLDRHADVPGRRARALLLAVDGAFDATQLRTLALHLLLSHDALRLRFTRDGDGWRQHDGGVGGALPVVRLDLSGKPAADEPALLRTAVDRMRRRLNLADGPLVQFAAVDRGPRPAGLLLVVHELAADVRSWRLLLDDLCTGWRQLAGGTPPRLAPAKPFLGIISERSATPLQPAGDDCRLPAPTGYEGRIRTRVRTAVAPAAAVASALATALLEWRGGRRLTVDIADHTACDGHGRRVGQLSDVDSVEFIAGHPGTPVPRCTAQVRYDHFGDLSTLLPDGAPLRIAGPEDIDFTSVPDPGAYPLSVTGQVQAGRLRLDWWCSPALRQRLVSAGVPGRVVNLLSTVDGAR